MDRIPRIPLAEWTDTFIVYLQNNFGSSTQAFADGLEGFIKGLQGILIEAPAELIIIVLVLLAWRLAGKKVAVFTMLGLFFIYNLGLWAVTMETIAMVISAVLLCMLIGIPLGILGLRVKRLIVL